MAINTRLIDYTDGSVNLQGYFAFDDSVSQPLPMVLVAHAWGGRDEFVCEKVRRLAGIGYAAFAIDMYGKGVLGGGAEENSALMQPFMENRSMLQQRILAGLQAGKGLREVNQNKIVAMGFCFGGLCVLDLARSGADIGGVVSFHGLLVAPDITQGAAIKARVLVLHGHDDPMVPASDITALQDELSQAGCDWQFHVYGNTMHAFTNPAANDPNFGTVFQPNADRRSWQTLENFLHETFAVF